jgi:hypothetical protein
MKYPITPEFLSSIPDPIAKTYQRLEEDIIADICSRFKASGDLNASAIEQMHVLQRRGLNLSEIEKRITATLNTSQQELDETWAAAVERNQLYFDYAITKADIAVEASDLEALQTEIEAIKAQTLGEMTNITQSMGFAMRDPVTGTVTVSDIGKTYQRILDDAEMQVQSGAFDYNTVIRSAVKKLVDSGLQTVDYQSGWHNRADVAARRAVMSGVSAMSGQYGKVLMDTLNTRYVEVTAHSGARDQGDGIENHKEWQGKVYYWSENGEKDPLGLYEDFIEKTGYGDGDGLCGWNCRHHYYAFIPGVSERTYTDEELKNIDPPPFEYQGKTYTRYQATQKMRQIETALRKSKEYTRAYREAGRDDYADAYRARTKALNAQYTEFTKAAGLTKQTNRTNVLYVSDKVRSKVG